MKIDSESLEELKQICAKYHVKELADEEAQDIGQRIVSFLINSEQGFSDASQDVDDDKSGTLRLNNPRNDPLRNLQ